MTALLGAGHTRGATTWITTIEDGGHSQNVVFPGCTSVNPLYRMAVRPSYPEIADDYRLPHAATNVTRYLASRPYAGPGLCGEIGVRR